TKGVFRFFLNPCCLQTGEKLRVICSASRRLDVDAARSIRLLELRPQLCKLVTRCLFVLHALCTCLYGAGSTTGHSEVKFRHLGSCHSPNTHYECHRRYLEQSEMEHDVSRRVLS